MTDTTELAQPEAAPKRRGLTAMRLAELQDMAAGLGIGDTAKMRKGDLITAIKSRQGGDSVPATTRNRETPVQRSTEPQRSATAPSSGERPGVSSAEQEAVLARLPREGGGEHSAPTRSTPTRRSRRAGSAAGAPAGKAAGSASSQHESAAQGSEPAAVQSVGDSGEDRRGAGTSPQGNRGQETRSGQDRRESQQHEQGGRERNAGSAGRGGREEREDRGRDGRSSDNRGADNRGSDNRNVDGRSSDTRGSDNRNADNRSSDSRNADNRGSDNRNVDNRGSDNRGANNRGSDTRTDSRDARDGRDRNNRRVNDDDDDPRGRRRNRQRSRDRKRRGGREDYAPNDQVETQINDDDVIVPVAGILELLDNYAFVRTSGYLPGPNDVYVPMGIVKKNGLRKGDAVTGAVRALREGEQLPARQKFNALIRLDTVNGQDPEQQRSRVEFNKLTPLYPQQRLRLETEPNILTTRIMDLVSPIGKGQRGLIVAPAKAGKTMVMQAVANAISTNNPECHLMVVLVDERPEEVTDMQRAVKGEVISSTFDRPATDHTTVAELAIERAKRLVELGHDVVVLLDSITKLGRAYNLAAPASGRILSGGVDSAALYPPKRFFGAARNIEHGGSLTILATALVETGSKMDEVIFEEFKGTGNMELKLDRQLANRRIFPAVDVNNSSTRREEILLAPEELKIMWKLRRVLAALDSQQGIELLIDRLKKSKSNTEFLMTVQKTSNIKLDED